MDLGPTNAMHSDILDFSNNTHHTYFSLLKLKPVFQVSSVEKKKLGLGLFFFFFSSHRVQSCRCL